MNTRLSDSFEQIATIKGGEFMAPPEMHLSDALRREGKYEEARACIADELKTLDESDLCGRLTCALELAKVERSAGNLAASLRILDEAAALADLCPSHERRARYRHGRAHSFQLLGETDKALIEYGGAAFEWERADRPYDAGCTENNLALILGGAGRHDEAHEHVARARAYFAGMPVELAQVDDTEAQIFLAEGKPEAALPLAMRAVDVFRSHDEPEMFRRALPTLIKAAVDCQVTFSIPPVAE